MSIILSTTHSLFNIYKQYYLTVIVGLRLLIISNKLQRQAMPERTLDKMLHLDIIFYMSFSYDAQYFNFGFIVILPTRLP
tara:strand:+ start:2021 stop:2260 length:240 start_codon:yes stop_codon:yes gene_type:complete